MTALVEVSASATPATISRRHRPSFVAVFAGVLVTTLDNMVVNGALPQPGKFAQAPPAPAAAHPEETAMSTTATAEDVQLAEATRPVLGDSWAPCTVTRWEMKRVPGLTAGTAADESAA